MKTFLPTSQSLSARPLLNKGSFNLSEALERYAQGVSKRVKVLAPVPVQAIIFHWQEVSTPTQRPEFAQGLIADKLWDYKFQYLGQFQINGQEILPQNWQQADASKAYENFSADMASQSIHNTDFEGNGLCNCTWLLDMLVNAEALDNQPHRTDTLVWGHIPDGFALTLTSKGAKSTETQVLAFSNDFAAVSWSHHTQF